MANEMQITPDEAREEYQRRQASRAQQNPKKASLKDSLISAQKGWLSGLGRGALQSAGDIGASVGNVPAGWIESLSGKRPYEIPHPHLINDEPKGFGETIGQKLGQDLPRLAFETLVAKRFAPFGGRSGLASAGLGALGGGLAGSAASEGNRGQGFAEGALTGGAGTAASEFPIFQRQAAAPFRRAEADIARHGIGGFHLTPEQLTQSREYLSLPGLAPQRMGLEQLMRATESGEYPAIHALQSNLGHVGRTLGEGQGADRLLGQNIQNLRRDILAGMRGRVTEEGHPEIARDLQRAQDLYRRHHKIKPYIHKLMNMLATGGALGAGAEGVYKLSTAGRS